MVSVQPKRSLWIRFDVQVIGCLCAAVLLLLGFAMLAQRRILSLINLFMLQGLVLFASTLIVAYSTAQHHLYWSAGLTLVLKALLLPWIRERRRNGVLARTTEAGYDA